MVGKAFRRFLRREDGLISVEAVLIVPLLFWVLGATYVFFDAYKTRNAAARATHTIGDMIARETRGIDATYLQGANAVLEQISRGADDTSLRVSVVRCVANCQDTATRELELLWSNTVGGLPALIDSDVQEAWLRARMPEMALGASVLMVESEVSWTPLFKMGLPPMELGNTQVMRPRFAPQICWESCPGT